MDHAINLIILSLLTIARLVMAFIAFADSFFGALMNSAGIPHNAQVILLVVAAVLLGVMAIRMLGGLLAGLVLVLLVLLLLNKLAPDLVIPQGATPSWLSPHTWQAPPK